jgi:prepilin-type N-terminal cleavage/methylation domain-containing protein
MNASRAGNKGFTLIELLIVVAIIAIAAGIVAPGISQMRQNSVLKSEARDLLSAFHTARLEAVRRNTTVTISFVKGAYSPAGGVGEYTVFIDEDAVGDAGYRLPDADEEVILSKTIGAGVSMPLSANSNFEGVSPAMWTGFTYRGLPLTDSGAPTTRGVVLQNANSRFYRLAMSPTGTVRTRQSSTDSWN